MVTYKPQSKPKITKPRSLNNHEVILTLLAEIYPKDFLIEWLSFVPLYNG